MDAPIAWITGGSRGIGHAIARSLAEAGHSLLLVAQSPERLEQAAESLRDQAEVAVAALDLRDPEVPQRLLELSRATFGRGPDLLVNNAGTAPTAPFDRTTDQQLDEVLDLHVRAPFRLIRAVLPEMKERGQGCLMQLASSAGLKGFAFTSAYTAAKHGMLGMTRALHEELKRSEIRSYAVCPGFVDTDLTRMGARQAAARGKLSEDEAMAAMGALNRIGRMHSVEEVAAAVTRLCVERPDGCIFDLDQDPPTFVP